MTKEIENNDSPNVENEEAEPLEKSEAPKEVEPIGDISEEKIKELEEKNRQLFERAKKAEDRLKSIPKSEAPASAEDNSIDLMKRFSTLKDYSSEELDYIATISKGRGLAPEEVIKEADVVDYITFKREKVAQEKNIPEPSRASLPEGDIEANDIAEMSAEEHRKLFDKTIKAGASKI